MFNSTTLYGQKFIKVKQLIQLLSPIDNYCLDAQYTHSGGGDIWNLHPDTVLHIEEVYWYSAEGITEVVVCVTTFYSPIPKSR